MQTHLFGGDFVGKKKIENWNLCLFTAIFCGKREKKRKSKLQSSFYWCFLAKNEKKGMEKQTPVITFSLLGMSCMLANNDLFYPHYIHHCIEKIWLFHAMFVWWLLLSLLPCVHDSNSHSPARQTKQSYTHTHTHTSRKQNNQMHTENYLRGKNTHMVHNASKL